MKKIFVTLAFAVLLMSLGSAETASAWGPGPMPYPGPVWGPQPYPGYYPGWQWNSSWIPPWVGPAVTWPPFYWQPVPVGYFQCTAFNPYMYPYTAFGQTQDQAAYNALGYCGGPNWMAYGCYIPPGYCQYRY